MRGCHPPNKAKTKPKALFSHTGIRSSQTTEKRSKFAKFEQIRESRERRSRVDVETMDAIQLSSRN